MNIVINGRTLGDPIVGITRYLHEVIASLDELAGEDMRMEVVIPDGAEVEMDLQKIRLKPLPRSFAWDYLRAERYARKNKALYVNLTGRGVWYKESIATIHDIRVLAFGDGKITKNSIKTRLKVGISYFLALKRAKILVTDSEFCKKEIAEYSGMDRNRIKVIGCGWEHLLGIRSDDAVFSENPSIRRKQYYLAVGSMAPHKNFNWIVQNAARHPECQYVIIGAADPKVWIDETAQFKGNVIYLGYQSDGRVKALLENARALVFPSLYEGYGVPPLEAIALKTPAIVSDIPVMREIYGSCVHYINPRDPSRDLDELLKEDCGSAQELLERESWERVGREWLEILREHAKGEPQKRTGRQNTAIISDETGGNA